MVQTIEAALRTYLADVELSFRDRTRLLTHEPLDESLTLPPPSEAFKECLKNGITVRGKDVFMCVCMYVCMYAMR